jgi:hypothetical protein
MAYHLAPTRKVELVDMSYTDVALLSSGRAGQT